MAKSRKEITSTMIGATAAVATSLKARSVFAYIDEFEEDKPLRDLKNAATELILIARNQNEQSRARRLGAKVLTVPAVNLTRIGRIKTAVVIAFSQRVLQPGETFVFLCGLPAEPADTLMVMSVGAEYEMFQSVDQPKLTEHIRRAVFERVFGLAIELASEGREGKPVGAMFVLGDYREVQKHCQQNIINPFKGYLERERNILDHGMAETVKEFCSIDGAFILKGNGAIMSAGTTVRPGLVGEELPRGLGSRHSAAAGITAITKSIAITISESNGTVRVWRRGQMITEIERATRSAPPSAASEPD
ncbi:MAG TPA: diadenylate cyclase [Phycisphaerae bacterium]|nr:diadenylate cyclase [Phycisphaerae bacterium]